MLYTPCCILSYSDMSVFYIILGVLFGATFRVIIPCVPPCHIPPSAMSCFMSPTDVTIRYATSMSCSCHHLCHHPPCHITTLFRTPCSIYHPVTCHTHHHHPCHPAMRHVVIMRSKVRMCFSCVMFLVHPVSSRGMFLLLKTCSMFCIIRVLHVIRNHPVLRAHGCVVFMSHVIHLLCHIRVMLHSQNRCVFYTPK